MSARSLRPDYSALDVPFDVWSEPFWQAGAGRRLVMPRCGACGTFRWPAGPFCPSCRSQAVEWVSPGNGRIYSFTILPVLGEDGAPSQFRIPTLVAFDEAHGVRLVSALVDAPVDQVAIGAEVEVDWVPAANLSVPVFRLKEGSPQNG
jgi:uncharacterized OB-fold protein